MAPRPGRRGLRLLSSRWGPAVALLVGAALAAPAMTVGPSNDDFLVHLVQEDAYPGYRLRADQLYEFTPNETETVPLIEHGFFPWFTERTLSFRFFRPLGSISLASDHLAFGRNALLGHLHGAFWYLMLLAAVAALHRRLLGLAEANLATVIYAAATAPAMALAWVAARHALMGAALAVGAVWLHVAWRQTDARWARGGSVLLFALGLLASESALGAAAFIVLHEVFAADDDRRSRILACLPVVVLAGAHLLFYVVSGYGVHGSGAYVTPFHDPVDFTIAFLTRTPVLLGEMFGAVPSLLWGAMDQARPVLARWGLALTGLVLILLFAARPHLPRRSRRRLLWLLASAVVALAPMVGGFLGGRLLFIASAGTSALLSVAIVRAFTTPRVGPRKWMLRLTASGLMFLHLGLAPLGRLGLTQVFAQLAEGERRVAMSLDPARCPADSHLLVVTGADPALSMYLEQSTHFYAPETVQRFASIRALSMTPAEQRLTRESDDTLVLEVVGPRPPSMFERVYRRDPLRVGEVVDAGVLRVEVEAVDPGGWRRARFTLDGGLDHACLGIWDGAALQLEPVMPVGEARTVPHLPGPSGS